MSKNKKNDRINDILDDIGEMDFLTEEGSQQLAASGVRVENIHFRLIRPDPAQPRRIFPEDIYQAFHEERLTPAQTVREFIQYVQVIARQKGRPFRTVLELIHNPDDERETEPFNYAAEELLLRKLVNLGVTLRNDGQVNPLTVIDKSEGVGKLFQIETGERRFWASVLMMDFLPGYMGDGTIPCIIVPQEQASVFRQAKENTARSGLNAIAMARQAALLILSQNGIQPPSGPVSNDFYRQALDYRVKYGSMGEILIAMGGIQRHYFNYFRNLLKLSDAAIELADRHDVDEGRLRHVVKLPQEHQSEMVRQIIEFNLSTRQVQEVCEATPDDELPTPDPYRSGTKHIVKSIRMTRDTDSDEIANMLEELHQSRHQAAAALADYMDVLQDAFEKLQS